MATHYICTECGSESRVASTCDNDDCVRVGLPRNVCNCEDGKHEGIMNAWNVAEGSEMETPTQDGTSENVLDLDSGEDAI